MKRIWIAAVTAALLLMSAVSAHAYSGKAFAKMPTRQAAGVYTQITDTEGKTHLVDGAVNAKTIENGDFAEEIAEYSIYYGEELLIRVTLNDILPSGQTNRFAKSSGLVVNGFYSVKFPLSATENTEVFLTGLSDSNVDLVQEAMINAKIENSQFSMESLDFIDAEKTNLPDDGDDMLCWAATTANMLHYTGWGQKAGFYSPDDILDEFLAAFDDNGSLMPYGLNWFFGGINDPQGYDGWAQVKDYGNSGKYLREYSVMQNMDLIDITQDHKQIIKGLDALEKGCGMGIALGWMTDGVRNGGHAITLWGYIIDKDFPEEDSNRYQALIVSDSDFDMPEDSNRRVAPNKLCVLNMIPYQDDTYDSWLFEGYAGGNFGLLESLTYLTPYSDDIAYEPADSDATLDAFTDYEFLVRSLLISNDSLDNSTVSKAFAKGDTIYLTPLFENNSMCTFAEGNELFYDVIVTSKESGEKKFDQSDSYSGGIGSIDRSNIVKTQKTEFSVSDYEPGEYTAHITIRKSKDYKEALYYNNTYSYDFVVTDKTYDLSNAKITAETSELEDGEIKTALYYDGLETLDILQRDDVQVNLYHSYCIGGEWSPWQRAYTNDIPAVGKRSIAEDVLPDHCTLYPNGEKVKFRLAIAAADETIPTINIYSDEIGLKYMKLDLELDGSHTSVCTPIESGRKSLADGEWIAFQVKDLSTYPSGEDLFCNIKIYAQKGVEQVELAAYDNVPVSRGGTSELIKFNSWSADLDGKYDIVVNIESDYNYAENLVSSLIVGKHYIYEVTTAEDVVDNQDGKISLREAVSMLKDSDEDLAITFADDVNIVFLNAPIVIDSDSKIEIDGRGVSIYGSEKSQLFKVESGGTLHCNMVALDRGYSKNSGGAIENNGGDVKIENSAIIWCKSGVSGGGIYSNGGSVTLKNCSLLENTSGYGGAVATDHGATVNLLNCNLFQNKSNGGAIYNNGGHMSVIYCTIADNFVSKDSSLKVGGITSIGTTDVFGSIITFNDECDLSGKINAYGNYFAYADDKVTLHDYNKYGDGFQAFMLNENLNMICDPVDTDECLGYRTKVSAVVENGIFIKNQEGKIAYSADGREWILTDVDSVFTDEEYSRDMLGKEHGALFGANSDAENETKIITGGNGYLYVYVPKPQEAVLIDRRETDDRRLSGLNLLEADFNYGTNIIQLEAYNGSEARSVMLWSSMEDMKPLCTAFVIDKVEGK